jgi:ribosomal protein S18 acetylase RimI-like enzyme
MTMMIRPFEANDLRAMALIRAQEWETEAYWQRRIDLYLRGETSPRQALRVRAAFVAVDEGRVVGFVAGHGTKRYQCDGELEWISVSMAERGQGIAGKLLCRVAAWFVEHELFRVCVDVDPQNDAARNLYSKYGANPLNEHWMVWQDVRAIIRSCEKTDREMRSL